MPGLTAAEITVEITPEVLTVSTRPREALRTTIAISPTGAGSMRRRPRPRGDVSSRWPDRRSQGRVARWAEPLSARCVGALLGVPHLTARDALDSLVASDAFSHAAQCRRCGGPDAGVGARITKR